MDRQPASVDLGDIKRVWAALHGVYGNRMLDNWRTGRIVDGEDQGIASAQRVWVQALRRFQQRTLADAVVRCRATYPHHPPTLAEFEGLCVAIEPRSPGPAPVDADKRLGMDMSPEAQEQRRADVAELLKAMKAKVAGGAAA